MDEMNMLLSFALGREKKPKKYFVKCNECGKLLNKTSMKKHVLTHKDKSEWPWSCALCQKRNQTQHDLIKHLRSKVHENDRVPMEGTEKWYQLINHDRMGGYVHLPKKKRSFSTEQSNIEDDLKDSILNALYSNIPTVCETDHSEKISDFANKSCHESTNIPDDGKFEQENIDDFQEEKIYNNKYRNVFDYENINVYIGHDHVNEYETTKASICEFSKPLDLSTSSLSEPDPSESVPVSKSLSSSESQPMSESQALSESLYSSESQLLSESQPLSESENNIESRHAQPLDHTKRKALLASESSEYLDENDNNLEARTTTSISHSNSSEKCRKLQVRITKLEIDPVIIEFIRETHFSHNDYQHVDSEDIQIGNCNNLEIGKTCNSENENVCQENRNIFEHSELDIPYSYMPDNSCKQQLPYMFGPGKNNQDIPFNSMHFSYDL